MHAHTHTYARTHAYKHTHITCTLCLSVCLCLPVFVPLLASLSALPSSVPVQTTPGQHRQTRHYRAVLRQPSRDRGQHPAVCACLCLSVPACVCLCVSLSSPLSQPYPPLSLSRLHLGNTVKRGTIEAFVLRQPARLRGQHPAVCVCLCLTLCVPLFASLSSLPPSVPAQTTPGQHRQTLHHRAVRSPANLPVIVDNIQLSVSVCV